MTAPLASQSFDTPFRMLAVDDEPDVLASIELYFGRSGFEVVTAGDSAEGLAAVGEGRFDVVVTDVMMPGGTGLELLDALRSRFPDLPVVLMTGYAQVPMVIEAIKNGAFDFITKPCDFEYLLKTVTKAATYSRLLSMRENYRAELEATVARRTDELEQSRLALEEEVRKKREFLVAVTHEMRTPLNGLAGALDLMAEAGIEGGARELLAVAHRSTRQLTEQFSRLVSLYRGTEQAASGFGLPQNMQGEL